MSATATVAQHVSITLGEQNIESGLTQVLVESGDGWTESHQIDGLSCRRNLLDTPSGIPGHYMYFQMLGDLDLSDALGIWATIEYYDYADPAALPILLQYDSTNGPYESRPLFDRRYMSGDQSWRRASFFLPFPTFLQRQNGGADLRIATEPPSNTLSIHRVVLSQGPPPDTQIVALTRHFVGPEDFHVKSVQGVVNRIAWRIDQRSLLPLVYVDLGPAYGERNGHTLSTDMIWLYEMLDTDPKFVLAELRPPEVSMLFEPFFSHRVLYDGSSPYHVPIASTYGAVNDAPLVDVSATATTMPSLPILQDFTQPNWMWPSIIDPLSSTQVSSLMEAYDWAAEHLLPMANSGSLAYLSYTTPHMLDYVFSNRIFNFDLDPLNSQDEIDLIRSIVSHRPAMTPVFGWPDARHAIPGQNDVTLENAIVELLDSEGDYLVAANLCTNLSFFKSLVAPSPLTYLQPPTRLLRRDPEKLYVAFVYSDGDNMQYDFNRLMELWSQEEARSLRYALNWTISPHLMREAPAAYQQLMSELRSRLPHFRMLCGPSGIGYVRPSRLEEEILRDFVEETGQALQHMGLSSVACIDNVGSEESVYQVFADEPAVRVIFMVEATHASSPPGSIAMLDRNGGGSPCAYTVERIRAESQSPAELAGEITAAVRPGDLGNIVMVYCHAWNNEVVPRIISETIDALGPDAVPIFLDELPFLIAQPAIPSRLVIESPIPGSIHRGAIDIMVTQQHDGSESGPVVAEVDVLLSSDGGVHWFSVGSVEVGEMTTLGGAGIESGLYLMHARGSYADYPIASEMAATFQFEQQIPDGLLLQ